MKVPLVSVVKLLLLQLCQVTNAATQICSTDTPFSKVTVQSAPLVTISYKSSETHLHILIESATKSWIGFGYSPSGIMLNTDAVIGLESGVHLYSLPESYMAPMGVTKLGDEFQTLTEKSFTVSDGDVKSTLEFILPLENRNDAIVNNGVSKFIYAIGNDDVTNSFGVHKLRGEVDLTLSPCQAFEEREDIDYSVMNQKRLLKIHGLLAAAAFGVLMPLAIAASIFRKYLRKEMKSKQLWFWIHYSLNVLSFLLVIVLFALAIRARNYSSIGHFSKVHDQLGLAILILVTIQVLAGIFRPSVEQHQSQKVEDEVSVDEFVDHSGRDEHGNKLPYGSNILRRKKWARMHRVGGIFILFMLAYQFYAGIEAYKTLFLVDGKVSFIFYWIWMGLGFAFLLIFISLNIWKAPH
ncbi:hypothetical protein CTEN210_13524 [Chaetoceros tenuissimus]|uniref:Cytochrome b561 domain-containing protein n=1 Tax=Chaetoceros tenuissimus TaxID=426638 RepID=A0AAD3HBI0_9STRA|nr:hypothetical protein CTEN210_13524 [Chaetoceros tenuissimus]